MKLQRDLREFIELLNCHGVEYVVVGGYAVAFHGYPRYTGDIDFFVRASESNAERIVRVLEDFGFSDAMKLSAALSKPGQVVQLGRPPHRIDVLTSASGIDEPLTVHATFMLLWNELKEVRMIKEITLRRAGGSVTATLPKEMTESLQIRPGDRVFAIQTHDGVLLTPHDPDFEMAMDAFSQVRRQYRNTLKKLAT